MNKKIIIVFFLFMISIIYLFIITFKIYVIDGYLLYLYSIPITLVLLIVLVYSKKKIKKYLGFKNNVLLIFNLELSYFDFTVTFILFFFIIIAPLFFTRINLLGKRNEVFIEGKIVNKRSNHRYYGYGVNFRNENEEITIHPAEKLWKKTKEGKVYRTKVYKGILGVRFYYKKDLKFKLIKFKQMDR